MKTRKYQRQSRVGYARRNMGTAVIQETEECIQYTCRAFNVSRSFVIAVALGQYFGIKKQEMFDE